MAAAGGGGARGDDFLGIVFFSKYKHIFPALIKQTFQSVYIDTAIFKKITSPLTGNKITPHNSYLNETYFQTIQSTYDTTCRLNDAEKTTKSQTNLLNLARYIFYLRFFYNANGYRTRRIWSFSYLPFLNLLYKLHSISILYFNTPMSTHFKTLPLNTYSIKNDAFKYQIIQSIHSLIKYLFVDTFPDKGVDSQHFPCGITAQYPQIFGDSGYFHSEAKRNKPPLSMTSHLVDGLLIHYQNFTYLSEFLTAVPLKDQTLSEIGEKVKKLSQLLHQANNSSLKLILVLKSVDLYCQAIYLKMGDSPDFVLPQASDLIQSIKYLSLFICSMNEYLNEYCELLVLIHGFVRDLDYDAPEIIAKTSLMETIYSSIKTRYSSADNAWDYAIFPLPTPKRHKP
jgi:hypothetical protein